MRNQNVWLITGASRGLGAHLVEAALAAGHKVVATGRNPQKVIEAVGAHNDLLVLKLDVNEPDDADAAVQAALQHFGRIDVLVNNAGNFYAGFFEEQTPEHVRQQFETVLFGPMNVARAVLPVLRKQRSGLLVMVSSTAGITGGPFYSAYAAAKFGLEGWTESLAMEVAAFGIQTMLVEPGFFRTELLSPDSTTFAQPRVEDYAELTRNTMAAMKGLDGKQPGDAAKLAAAIVLLAGEKIPPARFAGGADALEAFEAKANLLLKQADAHRTLSQALAHDDA